MTADLSRILVGCRGAGARRIIASCRALGLETVAAFGEDEAEASYVEQADYDVFLGPGAAVWTDVSRMVAAAMDAGCDAIHPGYEPVGRELELASLAAAANLALIGVESARAADLLDRTRVHARARRLGITVAPTEVVAPGQDGIEAAAAVGVPLVAAAATGGAEVRVEDFDGLAAALERTGRPAMLMHAGDRTERVEVVVVGQRDAAPVVLGAVLARGSTWELDPAGFPEIRHQAALLAADLGFVGVGVARFWVTGEGTAWFVGFRPQLPPFLELVERLGALDLVELQHRLTTTGTCGWLGPPALTGFGILAEVRAAGVGRLVTLRLPDGAVPGYAAGEPVSLADPVLAKLVATGADRSEAEAALAALWAGVEVVGVPLDLG